MTLPPRCSSIRQNGFFPSEKAKKGPIDPPVSKEGGRLRRQGKVTPESIGYASGMITSGGPPSKRLQLRPRDVRKRVRRRGLAKWLSKCKLPTSLQVLPPKGERKTTRQNETTVTGQDRSPTLKERREGSGRDGYKKTEKRLGPPRRS